MLLVHRFMQPPAHVRVKCRGYIRVDLCCNASFLAGPLFAATKSRLSSPARGHGTKGDWLPRSRGFGTLTATQIYLRTLYIILSL